ncbi:MAG: helix-turn-helix transcriptional regulator [Ruthenibacterium sp.]
MRFSYNKLWKLLIDKGMSKQELGKLSKVSSASIAKLGKGANVNSDVLLRICVALKCETGDIMEIIEIEPEKDVENEENNTNKS